MPGKEALAHIYRADRCSLLEAKKQLRAAISDRQIGARLPDPNSPRRSAVFPPGIDKIADPDGGPGFSPGIRQIPSPDLWRSANIRAAGTVNFFGKWYAFELRRDDILRIWPRRSTRAAELRALKWLIGDLKERGVRAVSKATRRKHAIEKFGISSRAFDERVWWQALAETGLSEASRAGRKSGR
jgi:hypothetical protein